MCACVFSGAADVSLVWPKCLLVYHNTDVLPVSELDWTGHTRKQDSKTIASGSSREAPTVNSGCLSKRPCA